MKKMTIGKMMLMCVLMIACLINFTACDSQEDVVVEFIPVETTVPTEGVSDILQVNDVIVGMTENSLSHEEITSDVTCDVNTRTFYYDQLNDIEKEIYDNLMDSKELFIENKDVLCCSYSGESGYDVSYEECAIRAFYAYMYDNPMASMWVNSVAFKPAITSAYVNGEYSHIESIEVYITVPEESGRYADFVNPDEAREAISMVEGEVKDFTETLTGTDKEKLTQIHDWILADAMYDETISVPNLRNPYGAIIQKNCVCSGFAYAYKYVADVAGLDVLYISGTGMEEPHAWNHVFVDGEWKLVDVTWDIDPISVGHQSSTPSKEYINEEGMLVVEYEVFYTEEVNYSYLFADITEEAAIGEHINESKLGFSYKS